MGESSTIPPSEGRPEDRLDSWKEIAAYLNRDVTTVQRWEKREGMPVHRHLHDRMGSVYASRVELDSWVRSRNPLVSPENGVLLPNSSIPAVHPGAASVHLLNWKLVATFTGLAAALIAVLWIYESRYFWTNPIAHADFRTLTDFGGVQQDAAISRDGHFVAFLSDRDGPMDVWVTQVGSGEFHNLTHGTAPELVNPSVRTLAFSPDGSLITFWVRKEGGPAQRDIGIWAVPTLGGQPRPYLQDAAELDWSPDGSRLAYHTADPGDPLFISDTNRKSQDAPIHTAPSGLHSHFPLWSPDASFIYFVQGSLPDKLDIWRISPSAKALQRVTSVSSSISHPVLLDRRTLLYLASGPDGAGPWLYCLDVDRRVSHQLTSGVDRYTSLAASADSRRLVLTLANPKRTLWRLPLAHASANSSDLVRVSLTTSVGFSPRFGLDGLLYVSTNGIGDGVWKLSNGVTSQLWNAPGAHIFGAPAISPGARQVAFSVGLDGRSLLYVTDADGSHARVVADALDLQGAPAWAPDGQSLTSAANDHGVPHLFRIYLDGRPPARLVSEYSMDPAWAPDGRFLVYSGPDIGTTFTVKAVAAAAPTPALPSLTLTRGARHLAFLPGGRALVFLRGEIQHKNLWLVDLQTGAERQLTNLPLDFDVRDFDISPDGSEVVLERLQEHSEIVVADLPSRQ